MGLNEPREIRFYINNNNRISREKDSLEMFTIEI